jgi:hypothetical protein
VSYTPKNMHADDPRDYIQGGRRCAVRVFELGDDPTWWVGTSPRNGDHASVEGNWEDWVRMARGILKAHAEAVAKGYRDEVEDGQ